MRVLLVRLGAFGDIIHTLPLAADLAAAGHEVGWLCEDRWACVLEGSSVVVRTHTLPRSVVRTAPWSRRVSAVLSLMQELRRSSYDAVIDAQGLAKSAVLTLGCASPLRCGHGRHRAREGAWLAYHRHAGPGPVHVIDQQRQLARTLGCDPHGSWRFPLPVWAAEDRWAGDLIAGNDGPWVLNVGAGWPTKVWPVERQVEFLQVLGRDRVPVMVVWGGTAEHDVARRIVAEAGHGTVAPPTTIPQLAHILRRARVVVSGDTGPLHLALAMGAATVGLFGPVPAQRNGPQGPGHRNLQAPGAAWERRDVSKVDMGAITVDAVLREAHAAMAELPLRS